MLRRPRGCLQEQECLFPAAHQAETVTSRAGAERAVKRKQPGLIFGRATEHHCDIVGSFDARQVPKPDVIGHLRF